MITAFSLTWQADNGGLFVGGRYGKTPLEKHISPKKTVEGIMGAFLVPFASAITMKIISCFWDALYPSNPMLLDYAIFGIVVPFTAITGDLIESFFKRCAGVKDSGTMLPGHGGMFDRVSAYFRFNFCR